MGERVVLRGAVERLRRERTAAFYTQPDAGKARRFPFARAPRGAPHVIPVSRPSFSPGSPGYALYPSIQVPLVRIYRAHTCPGEPGENDGLDTGITGGTAAALAWLRRCAWRCLSSSSPQHRFRRCTPCSEQAGLSAWLHARLAASPAAASQPAEEAAACDALLAALARHRVDSLWLAAQLTPTLIQAICSDPGGGGSGGAGLQLRLELCVAELRERVE